MLRIRVIPTLLLQNGGLVKGSEFTRHRYVGDPINAVRIFNEKEVDELVFLDIGATLQGKEPDFDLIRSIATEAFMPFAYGGGITSCAQIEKLFYLGVEKVVLNSEAYRNPQLVRDASSIAGSASIVVSIDTKNRLLRGSTVRVRAGTHDTKEHAVDYARRVEELGAGEIIHCAIDREGTQKGYDLEMLRSISEAVSIPVVAAGGAANLQDFVNAIKEGKASAVAAGDMFVFHGKHKAVLIKYPAESELTECWKQL
ncbi:MAG: imidazole glycerol phosphate synthase subunit HisF [Pseudomonadales bacterium]|nr:imidazole glycerol phosphate synthase subunit HisF [Pseudomonadales bacterium]